MTDLLAHLSDQPIANLIAIAGLVFLFIAAVGKVVGKIEPDARGRILCGILGVILLPIGLLMHVSGESSGEKKGPVTPRAIPEDPDMRTRASAVSFGASLWPTTMSVSHQKLTTRLRATTGWLLHEL